MSDAETFALLLKALAGTPCCDLARGGTGGSESEAEYVVEEEGKGSGCNYERGNY